MLLLLSAYSIKQIVWNHWRHQFALHGYAAMVDDHFLVGVDKIIRGEEARKILVDLNPETKSPDPGYENLLLRMKVKNISNHIAYPWYYDFSMFSEDTNSVVDRVDHIYFDFLPYGDYKALNSSLPFLPGETWDGTTGFQIQKGKNPQLIEVLANQMYQRSSRHRWISLSNSVLSNKDLFLFSFWLAFILAIWALWETYKQRTKRSDGVSGYLAPVFVILFIPFVTLLIINPSSFLADKFLIGYFFVLNLVPFVFYFVAKKSYIAQFNWLSRENMKKLIDDFTVRMQWENPIRITKKDLISIQNPNNNEKFIFEGNTVRVNHPAQESKQAKDILIDLFCNSPFDYRAFYKTAFLIFFAFLAYFILILVLSGYYL